MQKKGQALAFMPYLLFGLILVFVFAIIVLAVSRGSDEILNELKKPQNFGSDNLTVENINKVQDFIVPAYDQMVFILLIAVILGFFVIAIFTDYHPVILGVFIIFLVITTIIAGLLVNAYDDVRTNPELSEKSEEFNLINLVFDKPLPVMIVISGVIGILILLSKRGRVGGA